MSTPFGHGGRLYPSRRKLTNNNLNRDFKTVERPLEVEKDKLDRKIFSSWKIKRKARAGFERNPPPHVQTG